MIYKIKYSKSNANILNRLINVSEKKIISRIKIKSNNWLEFELLDNDPFVPAKYLDENELFKWFSIIGRAS